MDIEFKTKSSTLYIIKDIEESSELPIYTGMLQRISERGILDINTLQRMDLSEPVEVLFSSLPKVGESFYYIHPELDGCLSSVVKEII